MALKFRQLEVFDALMTAGSVSHAAERLNVTQPAVSLALSALESELGFRLFNRSRGVFSPTPEAQMLHSEAERGLLTLARIERRAAEIRTGALGGLTIASNGAAAINLLPRLIAAFQDRTPGIHIDLRVRSSRQVATLVSGHHIDIGLLDAPVPVAGLDARIFRLRCVCIMRADDPLAAGDSVGPEMLDGRPVIAITGDHPIDRRLDGLLAEANVSAERRVSASFFAIARNLVAAGAGVALVDRINGCLELNDGVVWRPFAPRIDFELALVTARGQVLHRAAARFREFLETALDPSP